jgi:hypothetical protein
MVHTKKHKEAHVKSTKAVKEAYTFLGLTLAFSYFVFWGPLALFRIPTISFVSEVKGPTWAVALFVAGGFVPSLVAIFLTWSKEGCLDCALGRRIIQFKQVALYVFTLIVIAGTAGQPLTNCSAILLMKLNFWRSWEVFYRF